MVLADELLYPSTEGAKSTCRRMEIWCKRCTIEMDHVGGLWDWHALLELGWVLRDPDRYDKPLKACHLEGQAADRWAALLADARGGVH